MLRSAGTVRNPLDFDSQLVLAARHLFVADCEKHGTGWCYRDRFSVARSQIQLSAFRKRGTEALELLCSRIKGNLAFEIEKNMVVVRMVSHAGRLPLPNASNDRHRGSS